MKLKSINSILCVFLYLFLFLSVSKAFGQCYQYLGSDNGSNQASYTQANDISMALDSAGTTYIGYMAPYDHNRIVVLKNTNGVWVPLDTSWFYNKTTLSPNLTVDKHGNPALVYTGLYNKLSVVRYAGSQWDTIGIQGFTSSFCYNPKLIFDSNNTPYVIFLESSYSNKISVMKYDGASWVYVGNPGFSSSNSQYLNLSIDTSGIIYAAYRDGATNKATVLQFNGSTWVNVGSAGVSQGNAWFVTLALDDSGMPYIGYSDSLANKKASVMKFNGSSWVYVGIQGFSPSMSNYHSLAVENGTPIISFGEGNASGTTGYATVMQYNGTSWSYVGLKNFSQGVVWSTSLAVTNSGTPIVAICDVFNGGKAVVLKFNGSSWESLEKSGISPGQANYTSMTVDNNGNVFVAFQDMNNGKKASVMTYNGVSWINVGPTVLSSAPAKNILLLHDQSNSLYLFYKIDSIAAPRKIEVLKYSAGVWTPLPSPGSGTNGFDARFDSSNNLYVTFSDSIYSNKLSVKKFTGSSWTYIGTPGFTTLASYEPSIDIAPIGTIYVSYKNSNSLFVSRYTNGVWTQLTNAVAQFPDFGIVRVGRSGFPFVLYQGSSGMKLFQLDFMGNWDLITSGGAFSPSNLPLRISLVLDADENQYFAFPYFASTQVETKHRLAIYARINNQIINLGSPLTVNSIGALNYPNLCFDTLGTLYAGYQDGGAVVEKLNTIGIASSSVILQDVCVGDTALFSLTAYSSLPLSYQWQIDQNGSGVYTNLSNNSTYLGVNTPSLSIQNITQTMDTHHYRCAISNACYTYYTNVHFYVQTPFISFSTLSISDTVCLTSVPYSLTGESPVGGTYSGNNISGNLFTADSVGNFNILYTYTNSFGCTNSNSMNVEVVLPTVSVTTIEPSCGGTGSVTISGSGTPPFLYELDTLSQSSNVYTGILSGINYAVCMTDSSGCNACTNFIVADSCDLVWPGDANDDMIVDNLDILAIGIGNGISATSRSIQTNVWNGYPSFEWPQMLSGATNFKHIDCNGDGTIDANDTLAVNQNFNLTHAFVAHPANNQERLTAPDLYFVVNGSSFNSGDIVDLEVWAGSSVSPVNNLYGIAFNLNYTSSLVQTGTESINYPNSWLGVPGVNTIKISKVDALSTTAYGAVTRINHTTVNGFGKIANFKFQLKNTIAPNSQMNFSFSSYYANDSIGNPILFNTYQDSIVVNSTLGIKEMTNNIAITVSPNPFSYFTTVSFNKELKNASLKIVDVLGNERRNISFEGGQLLFEKKDLQPGIYMMQLFLANELICIQKVVIQ